MANQYFGNNDLRQISSIASLGTPIAVADGGTGATTQGGAQSGLGLGTMSTQNANAVAITGGSVIGITDLAIADGGTAASTAENAKFNLGIVGILSTTGGINPRVTGTTTLYTVPAAKTAIVTSVRYRLTAAAGLTGNMNAGVGVAAGEDDIMSGTNLIGFNTTAEVYGFSVSGNYVTAAAAAVIKVGIDTAFTAGTGTLAVDLIGYLV